MNPKLQIHPTDSDGDTFDDLFDTGPPDPQQHPDYSQTRRRSRLRSVVSIPQTRQRLYRSSFTNEISPTPTAKTRRSQASSPPSARIRCHGQGRRSQLQPSPHRQLTPSPRLPAPGSSPWRTRASIDAATNAIPLALPASSPEPPTAGVVSHDVIGPSLPQPQPTPSAPSGFTKSLCTYILSFRHPFLYPSFSHSQPHGFCSSFFCNSHRSSRRASVSNSSGPTTGQPTRNFTLATAAPPVQPASSVYRPSPVSPALRQQILSGNYIDLAQLLKPSVIDTNQIREVQTNFGSVQLRHSPSQSKDLTPTEFAFAFSLYHDVICSAFPIRRAELDEYLSIVLDMALRFGGTGFYSYHVHFGNQAAGRIQQFNQGTYWGTLDSELYCRIFAAHTSLSVFNRLSPAAPPPPIIPWPVNIRPSVNVPMPKGVDRRGRPILYQGGRMVCNNFNYLGCALSNCRLLHVCSFCGGAHARSTCPHNPTTAADQLVQHLSTPVKHMD
ncbi:uncharacterized protein [Thunnus thynnus]|uniref:uncharacterized protein n=1 Tax=Thunnus thynnus TaxID=8237 RepID=UPI003526D917